MGVIGSRRMTGYGRDCVEKIVPQLVMSGWTIVSGLMYGVDQTAHEVCLDCGGRTIAVLGWGIDYIAGEKEQKLQDRIVQNNGLVVSLWENQIGTNWTFPSRNKVVADICHELIVVEAAAKSGALLTARMTQKLNKKIWAVPGPITSSVSIGTNKLLAEKNASPWLENPIQTSDIHIQDPIQKQILKILQNENLGIDEIIRRSGKSSPDISSRLSLLTLSGFVIEKAGLYRVSQG